MKAFDGNWFIFGTIIGKQKIHGMFQSLQGRRLGAFGVIPTSIIGIASPLCMYGTIPIAASFSEQGMEGLAEPRNEL